MERSGMPGIRSETVPVPKGRLRHSFQPSAAWAAISGHANEVDRTDGKKKDGQSRPFLLDVWRLLLFSGAVIGFDFGADGGQHLFHVSGMWAVRLQFQIFVKRVSGTRRSFQLAIFILLAVPHHD